MKRRFCTTAWIRPASARQRDQLARFADRGRHRLFGEHVAAVAKAGRNHVVPRRRDDDVEQQVRLGRVEHGVEIGAGTAPMQGRIRRAGLAAAARSMSTRPTISTLPASPGSRKRLQPASGHSSAPARTARNTKIPSRFGRFSGSAYASSVSASELTVSAYEASSSIIRMSIGGRFARGSDDAGNRAAGA